MSIKTLESANQQVYELSITRVFAAPRELVYEAFTNPEHVKQWMGPRGFVATHFEQDARPGGKWRGCLHDTPEGQGKTYPDLWQGGTFQEIVPPERIVYTFAWEGQGGQPTRETLITITFVSLPEGKTEMNFHQAFFDSVEQRDGHNTGWNSSFDRFVEYLNRKERIMQLKEAPEVISWPENHYVFVEKVGPFLNTAAQAWQELHRLVPEISAHNEIKGYMSFYKLSDQIYRAGVSLAAEPVKPPKGLQYEHVKGGKYSRFVLTGSYSHLPAASMRTFAIVKEKKLPLRDDYNIENYVSDPRVTPENELVTEILYPTA